MNFVNLAHGAFAMAGGYITVLLMNRAGRAVPRCACRSPSSLPALLGALLERTLYRHLYQRSHLDQVLFSIGIVFMAVAAVDYIHRLAAADHPAARRCCGPHRDLQRHGIGVYRLFIIVVCGAAHRCCCSRCWRAPASAAACGPRSTTRASRAGLGINVDLHLRRDLRGRLGPGRPRRRARRRGARAGPDVSAQVHDLFPDRRHGRRHDQHHRRRSWPRCCSASPTSPASTTSRKLGAFIIYA